MLSWATSAVIFKMSNAIDFTQHKASQLDFPNTKESKVSVGGE